jgi:hypothetical protein
MIRHLDLGETRRGFLFAAGLLAGFALALTTAGRSWETGAAVLGLGLAALVGLAQTCSA